MKRTKVLAKAVLQNKDGLILLLRRSETDTRRPNQWDFPGGGVEDDEDFVSGATREILEEANISILPKELHLAYTVAAVDPDFNSICWLIFIGQVEKPEIKLSYEHNEFTWAPLEKAIEMITYDRQKNALIHIRDAHLFDA